MKNVPINLWMLQTSQQSVSLVAGLQQNKIQEKVQYKNLIKNYLNI